MEEVARKVRSDDARRVIWDSSRRAASAAGRRGMLAARGKAAAKIVLNARQDLLYHARCLGPRVAAEVRAVGSIPLPVVIAKIVAFVRCGFGAEVEDPAGYETAQDGDVGDNDGDVVFDVADAEVDGVGPVGLEEGIEAVAVLEVDFGGAACGHS